MGLSSLLHRRRPFRKVRDPRGLLEEAARAIDAKRPPELESIVISSFSAGYGALREILKNRANWDQVSCVVLADSLHRCHIQRHGR